MICFKNAEKRLTGIKWIILYCKEIHSLRRQNNAKVLGTRNRASNT